MSLGRSLYVAPKLPPPPKGAQKRKTAVFGECEVTVTVTVTEALVLRSLLEDRGRITESVGILAPVDRMKQKCS